MNFSLTKALKYFTDSDYRFLIDANRGKYDEMSDKEYIERLYKSRVGHKLDLDNPKTFNEKLQWLKLYDRKPVYTTMVDKYAVKEYVAGTIGRQYIIPTLGVWSNAEDIDFGKLPDKFVIKTTHDSQGIIICKDKTILNIERAKKKLNSCLHSDYYKRHREWPYKDVPHRIIAEKYMEDSCPKDKLQTKENNGLTDYKIHCFNGIPRVILVCQNRFSVDKMTEDFFSETWENLKVSRKEHPNSKLRIERPPQLEEMLSLAKRLSDKIPFVRVDFYIVDGRVYFGEMTFFPASGFHKFIPESFDLEMGEMLTLPNK